LIFVENGLMIILLNCSYDIHTEERKMYIRNKIEDSYKFETRPSRRLKEPEWPIEIMDHYRLLNKMDM